MSSPSQSPQAGALLIDVRSQGEYQAARLQGAICLPLPELLARIASVAPDKQCPILLYCASGARSEMARQMLMAEGYTQVVNGGGAGQVAMQYGLGVERG